MTKQEAIDHYKGIADLAQALGIKPPSIYSWGEYPPILRQLQLEALTAKRLKAEPECHKFMSKVA